MRRPRVQRLERRVAPVRGQVLARAHNVLHTMSLLRCAAKDGGNDTLLRHALPPWDQRRVRRCGQWRRALVLFLPHTHLVSRLFVVFDVRPPACGGGLDVHWVGVFRVAHGLVQRLVADGAAVRAAGETRRTRHARTHERLHLFFEVRDRGQMGGRMDTQQDAVLDLHPVRVLEYVLVMESCIAYASRRSRPDVRGRLLRRYPWMRSGSLSARL